MGSLGDDLEALAAVQEDEYRKVAERLQRQLAKAKARTDELIEAVYQGARDAVTILGPAPPVAEPKLGKAKKHVEVALVHATDWQCIDGDTVVFDREGVAGRMRDLSGAWSTGVRPTVRVTVEGGGSVVCTPDHPVGTPDGWVEAGTLRRGQRVAVLTALDAWTDDADLDVELARLLGYIVTDGTGGDGRQSPKFTNNNILYHAEVGRIASSRFGIEGRYYPKNKGWDQLLTAPGSSKHNPNPLSAWLRSFNWDHGFPVDVFRSNAKLAGQFLNRAWSGDGTLSTRGTRKQPSLELACGNDEVYARYMQTLLVKLGVQCSVRSERMHGCTELFHRVLVCAGKQNIARFADTVGVVYGKEDASLAAFRYHDDRRTISEPALFGGPDGETFAFRRVLRVDDAGVRETFDAIVPGKGWFVAQGVQVHNCGKVTQTFNRTILDRRAQQLAEKVAAVTELQRSEHSVDEVVVFFGGDMVEGVSVFPNQAYEVDATLNDQIFHVARTMETLTRSLVAVFKRVRVYCVAGNHGRLGRVGEFPEQDNADAIAYRICAERNTEPRIDWNVASSWQHIVHIGEYRALLIHGHEIKGFGGNTPLYGIIRAVSAWGAGVLEPFDAAYLGHFHIHAEAQTFDGRPIYIGNTPESSNQYASRWLKATGTPSQRLQFIDPKHGRVNSDHRIFLD